MFEGLPLSFEEADHRLACGWYLQESLSELKRVLDLRYTDGISSRAAKKQRLG